MDDMPFLSKVQELSDLELAGLLCLITQEHCIIYADEELLDAVSHELRLIASNVFGLFHAVVNCSEHMTVDDFSSSILRFADSPLTSSSSQSRRESYFVHTAASSSRFHLSSEPLGDSNEIANVVIARNLAKAPQQVQIQALELLRTGRIYTRNAVLGAPKRFLFIALSSNPPGPTLIKHLNDFFFLSHVHELDDGLPNTEETDDGSSSPISRRKRLYHAPVPAPNPIISAEEIESLVRQAANAVLSMSVESYLQNIVVFLRLHRAVGGGVSSIATKHFEKLARYLAPLHGMTYVTPSLVALAAKKSYPHRIQIVEPQNERSMQWGSDPDAVALVLSGVTTRDIIEETIASVNAPL